MIVHTRRIEYQSGQEIRIKALADVHYGSTACDVRGFKKFLDEDPEAYFIGNGDLLNSIVTSDIKRYRKSDDATPSDAIIDDQIQGMYEMLKPYRERIICLGTGNHEDAITKYHGTNPMQRLCELLQVPFVGYSWLLRILLSSNGGAGRCVIIRGHHGWGGGSRTQGADLTKYSKDVAYWDADVFMYGHVHRLQSDRVPRLGLSGERLISKPKIMILCGSWLKTYSGDNNPTYSEQKGYPPIEMGGATLKIKPTYKWVDMRVDL